MSRVAKQPVVIPSGVEIKLDGNQVQAKGPKGNSSLIIHRSVQVSQSDMGLEFKPVSDKDYAMAGTMRSLVSNLVLGVSEGFSKKLELVGVGYRAQSQGAKLVLSLGFSHPVEYAIPDGIKIETPSQTEIIVSGFDKALVGQVASEIRSYRQPEPYKGKGVRYADEQIIRKEAKKK